MKYQCAVCKGNFETHEDWSKEQALAEFKEKYPYEPEPDLSQMVCNDCYNKGQKFMEEHAKEYDQYLKAQGLK